MKIVNKIILSLAAVMILISALNADTILLSDGTYLVGKIVQWDAYHIIFKNSHGAFAIKKKQLVKLYITGSQLEDIELNKTLGNVIKDEDIINHYLAGMEGMPPGGIDKEDVESGIKNEDLNKKIRVFFSYYYVMGPLSGVIPSGWGGSVGYSQSINGILPEGAAFWAPLLYVESEYVLFSGENSKVDDISLYAGPRWEMKYRGGKWGSLFIQALPGFSYLMIENDDYNASSATFSIKASAGYEYKFGDVIGAFSISYLYVYDKQILLHGAGLSLGAVYKF